jgi:hypothetical protein
MTSLIYASTAIVFLVLVIVLSRRANPPAERENGPDHGLASKLGNGPWLHLSDRIFDSADARWLAEELSLPNLAQALTLSRKHLAICWLEALQSSFDEFVRTPRYPHADESVASAGGWQILWLTLRFKVLVSYALFVVKWFGPYYRLIPSFSWVPFSKRGERSYDRPAFASTRGSH